MIKVWQIGMRTYQSLRVMAASNVGSHSLFDGVGDVAVFQLSSSFIEALDLMMNEVRSPFGYCPDTWLCTQYVPGASLAVSQVYTNFFCGGMPLYS